MPHKARHYQGRIKAIERQYLAMKFAADRLILQVRDDSTLLRVASFGFGDLQHASMELEPTYFVRLFSEFENGLRDFWTEIRPTQPKMEDLIHSVASRRKIDDALIRDVHGLRLYRNSLIHQMDEQIAEVAIEEARKATCMFLGKLP